MSQNHYKVLLVDADMGLRDLDLVLGVQDEVFYTSGDLMEKACLFHEAVVEIEDNLYLLPASQSLCWEDVGRKKLGKLLHKFASEYDYILIDAPAGIGRGFTSLLPIVDGVCLVVEPSWLSLRDAEKTLSLIKQDRSKHLWITVNKMPLVSEERCLPLDDMKDALRVEEVHGVIPYVSFLWNAGHEGLVREAFKDTFLREGMQHVVDAITDTDSYMEPDWERCMATWHKGEMLSNIQEEEPSQAAYEERKYGLLHVERKPSLWKWNRRRR